MANLIFNKVAAPVNPDTDKVAVTYDSGAPGVGTTIKMVGQDEAGNKLAFGGFAIKDYRLVKVLQLTVGSGTYTPSDGCQALFIEAIGGGGAGSGARAGSSTNSCNGGGGAGAYSAVYITGPLKSSYPYVVGSGGVGAIPATGSTDGGDTTFDSPSVCTAKGGVHGVPSAAGSTVLTQIGGIGGAASGGVGDIKFDGCDGGWGIRLSGTVGKGGAGGSSPLSIGMVRGPNTTNTVGNVGKKFGGGGSAAFSGTSTEAGGNGADGIIRVWEFA